MRLVLVGTSYQRAPVELRELLAYDADLRRGALERLSDRGSEAVVLSTCNRTEVYAVDPEPAEVEGRIYGELAGLSGLSQSELAPALYTVTDEAAAVHLFRVAAVLTRWCPGGADPAPSARGLQAAARGTPGSTCTALPQALGFGKRVRTESGDGETRPVPQRRRLAAGLRGSRGPETSSSRPDKTAALNAANPLPRRRGIVGANRSLDRAERWLPLRGRAVASTP